MKGKKRIVVAFDEKSIKYAKIYGFNKALKESKKKDNILWEVEEYTFDSTDEMKGFIKGLSIASKLTLDTPIWKETKIQNKKKK